MPVVSDLMSTNVLVCQRSDSCSEVAERMRQGNVGILPVMEGGSVVGVVTDRDLALRHLAAPTSAVPHTDVGGCMTPRVISVAPGDTLDSAVRRMHENQVRRLVVMESGVLHGILTLDDVFIESGASPEVGRVVQQALLGSRMPAP